MYVARKCRTVGSRLKHSFHFHSLFVTLPSMPATLTHKFKTSTHQDLHCLLERCSSMSELKQLHAQIIIRSLTNENLTLGKLISFCAVSDAGDLRYARLIFDQVIEPNKFMYNCLIRGYSNSDEQVNSLLLYSKMIASGLSPNEFTLPFVLKVCAGKSAYWDAVVVHGQAVKLGFGSQVCVQNALINVYVVCGLVQCAQKVFDDIPEKTLVSWNSMFGGYSRIGCCKEAFLLFRKMRELQLEPDKFTMVNLLSVCSHGCDLDLGRCVHHYIEVTGMEIDQIVKNSLLDMYVKCGSLGDAKNVFDGILFPNSTTWNTIISGYSKAGMMEDAVDLFNRMPKPNVVSWNSIIAGFTDKESPDGSEFVCRMHQEGLKLDGFTFPCVLKTCGRHGLLAFGKQIHCYVIKSGFEYGCFTVSALIDMYSDCNKLVAAENLFAQYSSSISDSLAIWNSMLSGYVINEHNSAALNIVSQVHRSGAYLDSYTFSGALKACINLQSLRLGLQVHGLAVTTGYELDDVIGSILIDFYARMGSIKDAMRLFHRLPKKDTVAWSGLIAGCAKMGLHWFAFSLFRDMVNLDIRVDQFVISSILKACSSLTSLRSGKQIHAFCIKSGYEYEGVMLTSLIDMYSKCGEIDDGLALFECTPERDTICWTGIIVGCGQNGRAEAAINYFHEMVKSGLKPNEITYLGVLSACRHAGLVDEALAIFNSMKTEKGLETYVEHYNCMVDLLGQAGRFEEAEKLITAMPCEPNQTIWRSLLGACQTHNNIELVNIIDKNLLATLPENPSTYVTLSNVYAALGKWDDLSKMRKSVKKVGAKEAGKSWIEISS